jgi:excisionase family DNA binding protein
MTRHRANRNLTTGEIAELCGVNFRTVIRWIHRGHLRAFQLPGRGDNRVPVEHFVEFLQTNDMPIPPEIRADARTVLLVGFDDTILQRARAVLKSDGLDVVAAASEFGAGLEAGRGAPVAAVIDGGCFDRDGVCRLADGFGRLGAGVIVCGPQDDGLPAGVVRLDDPVDWTIVPTIVDDFVEPLP